MWWMRVLYLNSSSVTPVGNLSRRKALSNGIDSKSSFEALATQALRTRRNIRYHRTRARFTTTKRMGIQMATPLFQAARQVQAVQQVPRLSLHRRLADGQGRYLKVADG